MSGTFIPARSNPASPGVMAGAVGAVGNATQSPHRDPNRFLGLHWPNILTTVFVATLTAVATDTAISAWHRYRGR